MRIWLHKLTLFLAVTGLAASFDVIDIFINHYPVRQFHNVSFGLQHNSEYRHQCHSNGAKRPNHDSGLPNAMGYTANRRSQKDSLAEAKDHNVQLGIVLAVGAHSNTHYDYGPAGSLNGLMSVWDSWSDYFFPRVSNSTSLVLLLDERDFRRQNFTRSVSRYMDSILVDNMGAKPVNCAYMHNTHTSPAGGGSVGEKIRASRAHNINNNRRRQPAGCNNEVHLDQTYRVYYMDTFNHSSVSTNGESGSVGSQHGHTHHNHHGHGHGHTPFIIFVSVHKFPAPDWAKDQDEETLFIHWRPWKMGRFKTNYGYVKMTNWYSYHMLNLDIIDYFDYAGKLDNDVSFVAPFPETNLPLKLAQRGSKMLVSADGWYYDSPRVAQGCYQCLMAYAQEETKRCNAKTTSGDLIPGGINATIFWESNLNATFRAHFIVFWLGLYAAPETKDLARYWNDWHPRGMWDYRWGDQQWWPRPMAMFGSGDVDAEVDHYDTINTDNEKYVVHKLWPRQATVEKVTYFNFSGTTRALRDSLYAIAAKPYL